MRLQRGRQAGHSVVLVLVMLVTVGCTLFTTPPTQADSVRDAQWALHFYQAEKVWEISRGEGVTVGLVDSGVNADHPDLTGQVLPGGDISGTSDGRLDPDGHGTAMASEIAGRGHGPDNREGIMGLAPDAKILPVRTDAPARTARRLGLDPLESAAWGIRWAADHGAEVINVSLGFEEDLPEMREAVKYAIDKDAVVVASAGNEAREGNAVEYPAGYPGVVAVGAVDRNRRIWPNSQHGPQLVLAAPGVDIMSADRERYDQGDGTSDAAAYVSAIAALVRAEYPQLTAGQVVRRMITTADRPQSGGRNDQFGYGIADPLTALTASIDPGPRENPLLSGAPIALPAPAADPAGDRPAGRPVLLPLVVLAAVGALGLAVVLALTRRESRRR